MPLKTVPLDLASAPLPQRVAELLDDSDRWIERFHQDHLDTPVPAFVPSDFVEVYHALRMVVDHDLATGHHFCEWGSGVGTVTCLARLLGMDAVGIEVESDLITIANELAEDHSLEVEFVCGSFIPSGGDLLLEEHAYELGREVTWLQTEGQEGYEVLGLDPDDFDLIFAYPWPGEEGVLFDLFDEFAATGALLMTHHGEQGMRLQRKVS